MWYKQRIYEAPSVVFEFEVKLGKVGNSFKMTIPKEVANYLRLKDGDTMAIKLTDHTMEVRKKL